MPLGSFWMVTPKKTVRGDWPNAAGSGQRYESFIKQGTETFVRVDNLCKVHGQISTQVSFVGGLRVLFGGNVYADLSGKAAESRVTAVTPKYGGAAGPGQDVNAVLAGYKVEYLRFSCSSKDQTWNFFIGLTSLARVFELVQTGVLALAGEQGSGQTVRINDWLVGHTKPSRAGGNVVKPPESRELFKMDYHEVYGFLPEWYSADTAEGVNNNINGEDITVNRNNSSQLGWGWTNASGRYWVAVGPNVMNPNYKQGTKIQPADMYGAIPNNVGKQLDAKFQHITTGEILYVYAITGDTKEHTGKGTRTMSSEKTGKSKTVCLDGEGIYQTGISVINGNVASNNPDGSMIEFMIDKTMQDGKTTNKLDSASMGNYRLLEVIVYD